MADIDFDEYGGTPRFSGDQAKRLVNIAGAVCSVGLLVGVGIWGYNLAVRDVAGVPVIKAAAGPMRVAPANPGGEIADHQGMAVNAVPELRPADSMPDEIVLAPAPVTLSVEDTPGLSTIADEEMAVAPPSLPVALPLEAQRAREAEVAVTSTDDAVAMALAEALGQDVEPLADLMPLDEDQPISVQDDGGDGLARSLRPLARPARSDLAVVQSVSAAAVPSLNEIDPATLAQGTRLVQLGAFDTDAQARGEWAKLTQRFGDLMSGKAVVIQTADSGGRTFYRLRAHGFDGEDDARRFCAALLAEDAACIPVAHR